VFMSNKSLGLFLFFSTLTPMTIGFYAGLTGDMSITTGPIIAVTGLFQIVASFWAAIRLARH